MSNIGKWLLGFVLVILTALGVWALPTVPTCSTLSWAAGAPIPGVGFKIYWSNTSGTFIDTQSKDVANVLTYQIALLGVTPAMQGQRLYFVVTAYSNDVPPIESGFSNETNCKMPPSPPVNNKAS